MNPESQKKIKLTKAKQEELNRKLTPVYRRTGFITFAIGLAAILIGLAIDRTNETTPIVTVALLVVSVPLVLWINTRMIRKAIQEAAEEMRSESK